MRVAVLGAGYAGLSLARSLESTLPESVDLVVVDEHDEHLVQHELHRVVRRPDLAEDITVLLADVLRRATVRRGRIETVDAEAGRVTFVDGSTLDYDFGAVCLGAETAFYGLPGLHEYATPLKRLEHARQIREAFRALDSGRVVVGGAGLSGIQVAGELAALAREEDRNVTVELVEQAETVAPTFPEAFQRAVADELTEQGVTVSTGREVERADDDAVVFTNGDTLAYDQLVWTGGITGSTAMAADRPVVNRTLRLTDATFALGDAARVVDADGQAVPASAQTAIRQARTAATNIGRLVEHRLRDTGDFEPRLASYEYDELGWLVSVGDGAVAQVGPSVLRGTPAKALKTSVGAGYLSSVGAVENVVELVREEVGW